MEELINSERVFSQAMGELAPGLWLFIGILVGIVGLVWGMMGYRTNRTE